MSEPELPPLPEPAIFSGYYIGPPGVFSQDQMLSFAREAMDRGRRAGLEEAARLDNELLAALQDLRLRYEVLFNLYAKHAYRGDASSDLRLALTTADLAIAAATSGSSQTPAASPASS